MKPLLFGLRVLPGGRGLDCLLPVAEIAEIAEIGEYKSPSEIILLSEVFMVNECLALLDVLPALDRHVGSLTAGSPPAMSRGKVTGSGIVALRLRSLSRA